MKILIMGLPGSGKTTLAEKLLAELHKNGPAEWLNADEVRKELNDWDFSPEGRLRQAKRMRVLADKCIEAGFPVICDFVCPTKELRAVFDANVTIWLDTIPKGRFADTNAIFEQPTAEEYDIRIDEFASDKWAPVIADLISILTTEE
jgi:adenylylsulfate kinase